MTTLINAARTSCAKVVIDFSSPNIAKPFHFGHLKSTILGNYLANLNTYFGNKVIRLNYLGDWGTQYGLLSLALDEAESKQTDYSLDQLVRVYVGANEKAQNEPNFYENAKRRFCLIEQGKDSGELERWEKIRQISLGELDRSYNLLGVKFDVLEFESDYAKKATHLVDLMKSKGLVHRQEDGVLVTEVEKNNRCHQVPILKSDSSSLYLTRDVAAALNRKEKFNPDKILYVVGANQEKHFHYMREIVRKLDEPLADKLVHVKMGKIVGMSTRSGQFSLLSKIIDEATERYIHSTKNVPTSKVVDEKDIEDVGRQLALAALFVYDMRNKRTRNYQFDWDLVMFNSERSGINLQTTYARLCGLERKAKAIGLQAAEAPPSQGADSICCEEATNLLGQLERLDGVLCNSLELMDPQPLVEHGLLLCKVVNRARQSSRLQVVKETNEKAASERLSLFSSARKQLELIIKLIGLKPLSKV